MRLTTRGAMVLYGLAAVGGLMGTWIQNLRYLGLGLPGALFQFLEDTLVSVGARSIMVDLVFLTMVVVLLMVREARRLNIRGVWIYIIVGMLTAMSFTAPLFMLQRERELVRRGERDNYLSGTDVWGVIVFVGIAAVYTVAATLR